MKDLIKTLFKIKILTIPLLIACLIFVFLLIVAANRNKKLALNLEIIFIFFLFFCISDIDLMGFQHLNPQYLVEPPLNEFLAKSQIVIYIVMILILNLRVRAFITQKIIPLLIISVFRNCFFWSVLFLSLISSLWSNTPLITFKAGLILAGINVVGLYIIEYHNWLNLFNYLRWNLTLIALLSSVIRHQSNLSSDGGGLSGITGSKNELGSMMALNIVLWGLQATHTSKSRWLAWGMAAFSFAIMLQANSTGAIIIFCVLSLLSALTIFFKKLKFHHAVIAVTSFLSVVIMMYFVVEANLERIILFTGKDLTFTGRTEIWADVWDAIQERFWFGYGTYGFWQKWRGLNNPGAEWISGWWVPPNAHEGFLDIWVDLGLIGLLIFIASFLLSLVQSIFKLISSRGVESMLPLLLLTYVIMANLGESHFLRPNLFWTLYIMTTLKLTIDLKEPILQRSSEELRVIPKPSTQSGIE